VISAVRATPERPLVSVIVPAYRSQRTVAAFLDALAQQSWRDHEVILVDSSPDGSSAEIARRSFPHVRTLEMPRKLPPGVARNRGAAIAQGDLLVFSDPDVYPDRDWLARLVAAHKSSGEVIVGALDCWGSRWFDRGIHICKFSKWLPGQRPRRVDNSPTANMLVAREAFTAAGRFPDEGYLGDVILSRNLLANGRRLWLEPTAVVSHHHLHSLRSFLRERFVRGRYYGEHRAGWLGGSRAAVFLLLLVSALPVRFLRILGLVAVQAGRSGWLLRYLATWPLVAAGHAASLAGESVVYARLLRPSRATQANADRGQPATDGMGCRHGRGNNR
jgi:GT2 family glycosyltransferase